VRDGHARRADPPGVRARAPGFARSWPLPRAHPIERAPEGV
jgi:hypothetical protein